MRFVLTLPTLWLRLAYPYSGLDRMEKGMSVLSLWLPDEGFFVGAYIKKGFSALSKAVKEPADDVDQ